MKNRVLERRDTQQLIVDGLCSKVRTIPLSRVRIAELINDLNINRNTFYYYFSSKFEVAYYAFRRDLDARIRAVATESELVVRSEDDDPCGGLAFYARSETGARMLNHEAFISSLIHCVSQDPTLYRNLFTYRELEFINYARTIWKSAISDDLDFMLDGRYMPPPIKELLIGGTVSSIIELAMYCIAHPELEKSLCDKNFNPFQNYLLDSLHSTIQRHPLTTRQSKTPPANFGGKKPFQQHVLFN